MHFRNKKLQKLWDVKQYRYGLIGAVVVLVIASFSLLSGEIESGSTWITSTKGPFIVDLVESGEVQAVRAEYVRAPEEWRMDLQIVRMAEEGTLVKKGDFLVQFDTSTLDEELTQNLDNLKQAEADLRSTDTEQASTMSELEANLKVAEYTLEAAKLTVDMMKFESRSKQEESEIDLKKAQINYEEAVEKIKTQKIINATERQKVAIRLEHERNDVQEIKDRIELLTLYSPNDGMVVYMQIGGHGPDNPRYKVAVGEKVDSGAPVISIPDLSSMRLLLKVNELDADKIAPGQNVLIRLDAFEDQLYHGKVWAVSSMVEKDSAFWQAQAKAPSIEVIVLIDETSELLKPGMTAQARIVLTETPDVVSLPLGAVFEVPGGETVVFPKKGYPNPVKVTLGRRNSNSVVIEKGVASGEEIADVPPDASAKSLGWFAEMERRRTEFAELVDHIETMDERGIKYTPANPDSGKNEPTTMRTPGNGSGSSDGGGEGVVTTVSSGAR